MDIDWRPLKEVIEQRDRFLITSHVRADCDAIGSELGLAFATIVEALDNRDVAPPRAVMESLAAAYERMERPSDGAEAWARLRRRSCR